MRAWILGLACLGVAGWVGCGNDDSAPVVENGDPGAAPPPLNGPPPPRGEIPDEPETEPAPEIPPVVLPAEVAESSVLKMGDALPEATLPNLAGEPTELASLLGEKSTVLLLWDSADRLSEEAIYALAADVDGKYPGIATVGVAAGETAETAKETLARYNAEFPNLVDADKSFAGQIATDDFPRLYLLDAGGKVIWMGSGFGSGTEDDLFDALKAVTYEPVGQSLRD